MNDDTDLDATDVVGSHDKELELQDPAYNTPFTSEHQNVEDFVVVQCSSERWATSLAFVARIEEMNKILFMLITEEEKEICFIPLKNFIDGLQLFST